ncbi:receptor-type tyrosine-protein phosphatase O-like isoform X2 [Homarus americanus]|nr:receptor-type tyrosine-protein phosphatase O-like isoform X2 [Homarus americanus]
MTLELAIGIPLGVVALLIIISVIVYFSCRRKKVIPEVVVTYGTGTNNVSFIADSTPQEEILKMEFEKNFEEQVYSKSTSIALQHRDRNRYEDILPFDVTLVRLNKVDYINASYIFGKKFIATQDPLPDQDDDFWQLIWEQRVQIIVRLSTDNSSQTVARYIDDRGDNTWVMGHDELNVSVLTTHNNGVFYKRTFKVSKDNDVRFIEHFHMTNWPEGRVPQRDDTLNLIVSARSASIKYGSESPTLIHCGAGCGRTGTIIALWHMIDEFLADRMVNIVRTVESMRRCRMSMVKSVEQYISIYKCFEEFKKNPQRWQVNSLPFEALG